MNADPLPRLLPVALLGCLLVVACAGPGEDRLPEVKRNPLFHDFSQEELPAAEQTVQDALESQVRGATAAWRGSEGLTLEVTPLRTFKIVTGHFCRDYRILVRTVALTRIAARTACRSDEGVWLEVEPAVEPPPQ